MEPNCQSFIDDFGNVEIQIEDGNDDSDCKLYKSVEEVPLDTIELSIFGHRFMSIAE